MVCLQANSSPVHYVYTVHNSLAVPSIPGAIKIFHGHCVCRWAVIWSHRSASRWYSWQSCRPATLVFKIWNIGVLADNSKSRFGRRRPFMIVGGIITAVATILFGFTRPVAGVFSEEGSGLVCILSIHAVGDNILIACTVQESVNMARHIRHLRHGLFNKRRYVSCGFYRVPLINPPSIASPSR